MSTLHLPSAIVTLTDSTGAPHRFEVEQDSAYFLLGDVIPYPNIIKAVTYLPTDHYA